MTEVTKKLYTLSVKQEALSDGQLKVSLGDLTAPLGLPMSNELKELLSLTVTQLSTYYNSAIKGTGFRAQILLGGSKNQSNPTTIEALSAVVEVDNTEEPDDDDSDLSDDSSDDSE
jgi:hypothetical protein